MNSRLCIELCAGCARLSSSLAAQGFKTMAVDHAANKHAACHPIVTLDLASEEEVKFLMSLLTQPNLVIYIHAAPPCGTCSRAREKKIAKRFLKMGLKEPQPLRSAHFPHGLPGLRGTDLRRVQAANSIYKNIAKILDAALQLGACISIENPTRSYMWATKWVAALIEKYCMLACPRIVLASWKARGSSFFVRCAEMRASKRLLNSWNCSFMVSRSQANLRLPSSFLRRLVIQHFQMSNS